MVSRFVISSISRYVYYPISSESVDLNQHSRPRTGGGRPATKFRPAFHVDAFRFTRQLSVDTHRRDLVVIAVKHNHSIPWPRTTREPAHVGKHKGLLVHLVSLLQTPLSNFIYMRLRNVSLSLFQNKSSPNLNHQMRY